MNEIPSMVDATEQLLEALRAIEGVAVTEQWPRQAISGPLVTVQEISNSNTAVRAVDSLAYQVDVWAEDADTARDLAAQADEIVTGIGLRRTSAQPMVFDGRGNRRTMRYSRKVDKRTLRLIDET